MNPKANETDSKEKVQATVFVLASPLFQLNAKDNHQVIFTKEFFVLKYGLSLMFCRFTDIEKQNSEDY